MVIIFSLLLIVGIIVGQIINFSGVNGILSFFTSVCLAYIMVDVGVEFSSENKSIRNYGWDLGVASMAAIVPALLWIVYFMCFVHSPWQPALLAGLSSAPTSAGVLFAMLSAAGLGATWVFKKARVLAVLDDLVTIILLSPLQVVMYGWHWETIAGLGLVLIFIFMAFYFKNTLPLPHNRPWLLVYAFILTGMIWGIEHATHLHLGVLIPSFVWGCALKMSLDKRHDNLRWAGMLDYFLKGFFILGVGLSFPKIAIGAGSLGITAMHVLCLTFLANIGKFILVFCYRSEASFKERAALGVAMFPRGEVGAAVLMVSIGYGLGGYENALGLISLAFNLILTGAFIGAVIRLLK